MPKIVKLLGLKTLLCIKKIINANSLDVDLKNRRTFYLCVSQILFPCHLSEFPRSTFTM